VIERDRVGHPVRLHGGAADDGGGAKHGTQDLPGLRPI
jgi:hypothetical protein